MSQRNLVKLFTLFNVSSQTRASAFLTPSTTFSPPPVRLFSAVLSLVCTYGDLFLFADVFDEAQSGGAESVCEYQCESLASNRFKSGL